MITECDGEKVTGQTKWDACKRTHYNFFTYHGLDDKKLFDVMSEDDNLFINDKL